MKSIILTLLTIVLAITGSAQTGQADCLVLNQISGRVVDRVDSRPVAGALVCLRSFCWPCATDNCFNCTLTGEDGLFFVADQCTTRFAVGIWMGGDQAFYVLAAGYDSLDYAMAWDAFSACPEGEDQIVFGEQHYSDLLLTPQVVGVGDDGDVQEASAALALAAYPNPFNAETKITFSLSATSAVELTIVDIGGRMVKSILTGALSPGQYEYSWNGSDARDRAAASGVYFCRLLANGIVASRKIVLLK